MARWDLTDDEVEAVLAGTPVDGVAPGLTDLVRQLRLAPADTASVPPSAALAEFVSVAELSPVLDLTPIPEETSIMTKLSRRLATTTGRAVVVAAVVLGTAGAAQARGVVDVRQLAGRGSAATHADAAAGAAGQHEGDGRGDRGPGADDRDQDGDHDSRGDDGAPGPGGSRPADGNDSDGDHVAPAPGPVPVPCNAAAASAGAAADHAGGSDPCRRPPVTLPEPSSTVPGPRPTIPVPTVTLPTVPRPTITICEHPVPLPVTISNPRAAEALAPVKTIPCPPIVTLPPITIPADGTNPGRSTTTLAAPGPAATR